MGTITILNYQGSKASLMPFIHQAIQKYIAPGDKVCDIFSGAGSVGAFLKTQHPIVSNDAEKYASIISSALLNTPSTAELTQVKDFFLREFTPQQEALLAKHKEQVNAERAALALDQTATLIDLYTAFPTIWNNAHITAQTLKQQQAYNLFLHYFAGTYFGIEQAICIDALVKTIHLVDSSDAQNVLFSCLFFAMKETVFSKDGHMAQPLNISKNSARHLVQRKKNLIVYFTAKLNEFIAQSSPMPPTQQIFNLDMSDLLRDSSFNAQDIRLIYADPPYTDMQYSRYYHLLNVAANYDYPQPTVIRGQYTTGLYTQGRNQSDLSKKSTAKIRLEELFQYCKAKGIILALSYAYPDNRQTQKSDRYTMSIEELVTMANRIFGSAKVQIEQHKYQHANHRNSATKEVIEYLILCGKERNTCQYDLVGLKSELKKLTPTSKNPIYDTHLYWSQKSFNIIDTLLSQLSSEGDVVFDPFMGSGVTVLEAAKKSQSRMGIGCDVNEMSSFIIDNILHHIPKANLKEVFQRLDAHLLSLRPYYQTTCTNCNGLATITKVVFDKPVRTKHEFTIKAISYQCPTCGKLCKDATPEDYAKFQTATCTQAVADQVLIQNSKIAVGPSDKISDIFTPRNFSVLNDLVAYINASEDKAVLRYLLMSVLHLAKITDTHSNSQWPLWIPKTNCVEKNIIDLLQRRMKQLLTAQKFILDQYPSTHIAPSFSALTPGDVMVLTKGSQHITNDEIPDDSVSLIITDPPYLDQVLYSEYMQLYKPFVDLDFNITDEIIVSAAPERKRDKDQYFTLLFDVFKLCRNKLKENHIMCLFFHDSNLDVWVRLLDILEENGFQFISQEHIKKSKTVKNILSPKKSLNGDAVLFFENTRTVLPKSTTSISMGEIKQAVYLEAKKLLEKNGDLSTPELYDLGIMEMLIANGWLVQLSKNYKSLVEIFEEYFIWQKDSSKWHLQ